MRHFILSLVVCLLCACGSIPFSYNTYHGVYNDAQIDSIYNVEKLPQTGWIISNFVDDETNDTIYNKAFYIDLSKQSKDSVIGVKYTHRKVDTIQYFTKQLIIDNKKRLKK